MADILNSVTTGTALPEGFEESLQPDLTQIQEQQQIIATQIETQTADYERLQENLSTQFVETQGALEQFEEQVLVGISDSQMATEDIIAPFQSKLEDQITNLRNAYDVQINQQAKQIDALVGQGAFGGNAYRAQQAYSSSMQQLTAQSLGQIAQYTIDAERTILDASLQLNQQTQAQRLEYVKLLGTAASLSLEAASVYTRDSLGILTGKTSAVNSLIGLQAGLSQQSVALQQQASQVFAQSQLQVLANRTALTQAEMAATAQAFSAIQSRRASDAASEAQTIIAEIQADAAIETAELQFEAQQQEVVALQPAIAALEEQFSGGITTTAGDSYQYGVSQTDVDNFLQTFGFGV